MNQVGDADLSGELGERLSGAMIPEQKQTHPGAWDSTVSKVPAYYRYQRILLITHCKDNQEHWIE